MGIIAKEDFYRLSQLRFDKCANNLQFYAYKWLNYKEKMITYDTVKEMYIFRS